MVALPFVGLFVGFSDIFSGQAISTVLLTGLYTFGFGISMYVALRVCGNWVWPGLLHAMTDPSTVLSAP